MLTLVTDTLCDSTGHMWIQNAAILYSMYNKQLKQLTIVTEYKVTKVLVSVNIVHWVAVYLCISPHMGIYCGLKYC